MTSTNGVFRAQDTPVAKSLDPAGSGPHENPITPAAPELPGRSLYRLAAARICVFSVFLEGSDAVASH